MATPPPATCPIGWQPSPLTPVFYGSRDLGPADGAPVDLRLFFPSLDGAVSSAPMLTGCGGYPLVVLCHGNCNGDTDHFRRWFLLPAQLARSGYVVVVPRLAGIEAAVHPSEPQHPDLPTLTAVLHWARRTWEHHDQLLPGADAVVGHSYGALLGARFAAQVGAKAFAGLSGVWEDWPSGPLPVEGVASPLLVVRGGDAEDLFTRVPDNVWARLRAPKHRVQFTGGSHWDYLPPGLPCDRGRGSCGALAGAAADLVTMFLGRYLAPEHATGLVGAIPGTLAPPPLHLTPEQEFYAGGFLTGWGALGGKPECGVTVEQELAPLLANTHSRETHSVDRPCAWVHLIAPRHQWHVTGLPAGYHWCDECFPARADG